MIGNSTSSANLIDPMGTDETNVYTADVGVEESMVSAIGGEACPGCSVPFFSYSYVEVCLHAMPVHIQDAIPSGKNVGVLFVHHIKFLFC